MNKELQNKVNEIKKFFNNNLNYIVAGLFLLLILGFGFYSLISNKPSDKEEMQKEETKEEQMQQEKAEEKAVKGRVYTVKKGDNLWKIAEEAYGSGYNAIDIAKANNLKNPNLLYVGQKLNLPDNVPARKPTRGDIAKAQTGKKAKETPKEYIVKRGDYLWKIAVEVYGDGYGWVKIARANRIKNPDLIYSGQKLVIPPYTPSRQ